MKRKVWIISIIGVIGLGVLVFAICKGDKVLSSIGSVASIIALVWLVIDIVRTKLLPKMKEHSCLTSPPPKADSTNVIGRKEDLERLWKVLREKHHIILTGFGGIGKTKLAQLLFHEYEKEFDEVAWIDYQGNLKDSILSCVNLFREIPDIEERWKAVVTALNNDQKKKLFIIDNVDHTTSQHPEQDKELRGLTGWKNTTLLLTSRMERLAGFDNIALDELELDNCVKVFELYYSGKHPKRETVVKLIELANRHTLTIELLAKGVEREDLDDYCQKLIANGFEKIDRKTVTDRNKVNAKIAEHLKKLFDMQQRSEDDKKVLNSFAILPEKCRCSLAEVEQWLGFKDSDLDEVIKDGWLSYDEESKKYYLHPLVRTIVRFDFTEDAQNEKNIAPQGTADKILDYFWKDGKWYDIANGYVSLQRLIGIVEAAMGAVAYEESERFGSLYHNLGYINYKLGAYDKALEYYEKALAIREKVLGTEHTSTAITYNNIGSVYDDKGDYDKALEYYFKALPIVEKNLGSEHPNVASTYNNIGTVYLARGKKGDYDKALEYYFKALPIVEKNLGPEHPNVASTYNNIAAVYDNKGDYDKALEYYEKALKIWEKVFGTEHPDTASTYNNIGSVYWARGGQGDYDKALEYFEKALPIVEKNLGTEHPNVASTYNNIAAVYDNKGDYDKALEYYEKALKIWEKVLGIEHPLTATSYNNIGSMYYQMKKYPEALNYLGKALQIRKTLLGDDHPYTIGTQEWIDLTKAAMSKGK